MPIHGLIFHMMSAMCLGYQFYENTFSLNKTETYTYTIKLIRKKNHNLHGIRFKLIEEIKVIMQSVCVVANN